MRGMAFRRILRGVIRLSTLMLRSVSIALRCERHGATDLKQSVLE